MVSQLGGVLGTALPRAGVVGLEAELGGVLEAPRETEQFSGGVGVVSQLEGVLGTTV